ncbi:MAG: hypothetical protein ACK5GN_10665 [Pseudomonadota bacterium]|jgi:hypothetical protein
MKRSTLPLRLLTTSALSILLSLTAIGCGRGGGGGGTPGAYNGTWQLSGVKVVDQCRSSPAYFMKLRSESAGNGDFSGLKGELKNRFSGLKSYRDTFRSENRSLNQKSTVVGDRSNRLHEICGLVQHVF